jgi:uncharacterized protein YjbI with pentapeptide repeats
MLKKLLFILLPLFISGCIESSGSYNAETADPSGIWLGQQAIINDGAYSMRTIIHDGVIAGISEEAGVLYAGTYEMQSGKFMVSDGSGNSSTKYKLYDLTTGEKIADGIVTALITEKESFTGGFSNSFMQEGELSAYYSPLYENPASISYITGHRQDGAISLDIADDGSFTGALGTCTASGMIFVPDPARNVYEVNYSLSGCTKEGSYSGLGTVSLIDEVPYFTVFAANDAMMNLFGFPADAAIENRAKKSDARSYAYNFEQQNYSSYPDTFNENNVNKNGVNFDDKKYKFFAANNSTFKNASFNNTYLTMECCNKSTYDYGYAIRNSDFSGASFINAVIVAKNYLDLGISPFEYFFDDPPVSITNVNFSNADFTNAKIFLDSLDSSFKGADFTDAVLDGNDSDGDFRGANFENTYFCLGSSGNFSKVDFRKTIFGDQRPFSYELCVANFMDADLTGANFEGVNFSYISYFLSNFSYANLKDTKNLYDIGDIGPTYFGNAWWTDGRRCAALSVGKCLDKIYDNGLTYEEYLSGKDDLDKDMELLKKEAENLKDEAVSFVKKTWSSLW